MRLKMFCAVVLLLLNIFDSAVFAQSYKLSNLKLKEKSFLSADSQKVLSEKSPLLAGTLSFIVPGFAIGQLYNGQTNKFFTHSLISTGLIVSFFMLRGKPSDINLFGTPRTLSMGSLAYMLVYTFNWAWSVVDAVITANNINKQVKLQKYRSDIMNRVKFGFDVNKNKLNLRFAFEL